MSETRADLPPLRDRVARASPIRTRDRTVTLLQRFPPSLPIPSHAKPIHIKEYSQGAQSGAGSTSHPDCFFLRAPHLQRSKRSDKIEARSASKVLMRVPSLASSSRRHVSHKPAVEKRQTTPQDHSSVCRRSR